MNDIDPIPLASETTKNNEALWQDPRVISFSLRRHGERRTAEPRGALATAGIPNIQDKAKDWVDTLPVGAHITVVESPSEMPSGPIRNNDIGEDFVPMRTNADGEKVPYSPSPVRGEMTGSIYNRALKNAANAQVDGSSEEPKVVLEARKADTLIGDYFETCSAPPREYFTKLREVYGGTTPQFWTDYFSGKLNPAVKAAFDGCGLSSADMLSRRMIEFLANETESRRKDASANPADLSKDVILGISHEENLGSFLQTLAKFVEGNGNAELAQTLRDKRFGYNEGIDLHVQTDADGSKTLTVVIDNATVSIPMDKLQQLTAAQ